MRLNLLDVETGFGVGEKTEDGEGRKEERVSRTPHFGTGEKEQLLTA